MHNAAIRASWLREPTSLATASISRHLGQNPSGSPSNTRGGDSSQMSTCSSAPSSDVGIVKMRAFVTTATNSAMHGHGTAHGAVPWARSEERRVGKSVDLGGRRIINKKRGLDSV